MSHYATAHNSDPIFEAKEDEMSDKNVEVGADIHHRFTYHAPKDDQPERYTYLRHVAETLAVDILRNCPPSRERSLALTKLEEAIFWANASIARIE